jgi:AAA domain
VKAPFLESVATLLAEPEPGPTPFLVESLLVDGSIGVIQGAPKVGKTWVSLELALSVATGLPALGRFGTRQGPVVVILEESGRDALYRRLSTLARGRGIAPERLGDLYFAANRRVRLDDRSWCERILADAGLLEPRLVIFDPLVRIKGAATRENDQESMAPILDYMRDLRDALSATILFNHHTGHNGEHLRGTSDLEGYWESKISLREKRGGLVEVIAEHREAQAAEPFTFRQAWDERGGMSMRIAMNGRAARADEQVLEFIRGHPREGTDAVAKGVHRRAENVRELLSTLETAGTLERRPSQFRDAAGRTRTRTGWYVCSPGENRGLYAVPGDGTVRRDERDVGPSPSRRPTPNGGPGTDGEPHTRRRA